MTSLLLRNLRSKFSSSAFITALDAKSLIEKNQKTTFLDVRAPEEYFKARIDKAVNCYPIFTYLSTSDSKGVKELTSTFENAFQEAGICGNEHVITYENCLSTFFGASCRGHFLLKLLGHPNVSILNGGFESWFRAGLPVSSGNTAEVKRGNFKAVWSPSAWSGKDDISMAIKDKNAVLLDVRDLEEWNGETSSPYGVDFTPRKGRLPGAVHMLWKDFMEKGRDGLVSLKKPQDILDMCAAKGVTPDKQIIVYCFKGARASNTYIALKMAGFENVTNYFASWNEWSRDASLPIDSEKY